MFFPVLWRPTWIQHNVVPTELKRIHILSYSVFMVVPFYRLLASLFLMEMEMLVFHYYFIGLADGDITH